MPINHKLTVNLMDLNILLLNVIAESTHFNRRKVHNNFRIQF